MLLCIKRLESFISTEVLFNCQMCHINDIIPPHGKWSIWKELTWALTMLSKRRCNKILPCYSECQICRFFSVTKHLNFLISIPELTFVALGLHWYVDVDVGVDVDVALGLIPVTFRSPVKVVAEWCCTPPGNWRRRNFFILQALSFEDDPGLFHKLLIIIDPTRAFNKYSWLYNSHDAEDAEDRVWSYVTWKSIRFVQHS